MGMKRIRTWSAIAWALTLPIAAHAQETDAAVDLDRMRAYLADAFQRTLRWTWPTWTPHPGPRGVGVGDRASVGHVHAIPTSDWSL